MTETYVAYFARPNGGRVFSGVGTDVFELYDGRPLDRVNWYGEAWVRISDLKDREVHYIPETVLSL
ncbi:hypothetical protein QYR02_15230 [Microbacterium maritypicum]|uniref:hypothetical protein n=1 Tax=Microbacterium maritypicum TaxID=33918 RepID=UPI00267252AE|nr:hypothetical protein [Microbacterium liquefaciens]WKT88778.1 hypothetical protein QYR02_15230 [Microbacterium liquefaciens]